MKKKLTAIFLSMIMVLSLNACTQKENGDDKVDDTTTSTNGDSDEFQNSIMFCGSTSLYPIISSLASSFTEEYVTWNNVNSSLPEKNISIYVAPGGSGVGISALLDRTCNFGMLARSIKDKEKEELGDGYTEYVVAKDALTVSVNAENPICDILDDLSTETIRQIFAGEVTTWNEVEASLPSETIQVFIRDLSGGAYEVFQTNIMGDSEVTASATQSASMTELAANIAANQWAIGYAGFGAYNNANADGQVLKAMKVDGIECSEETIISGDYKVQRPVMFVNNTKPTESEQAFIDYVFSQTGYDVIIENGYIPAFNLE